MTVKMSEATLPADISALFSLHRWPHLNLWVSAGGLALVKWSNIMAPYFPWMRKRFPRKPGEAMQVPRQQGIHFSALKSAKSSPPVLCKRTWVTSKDFGLGFSPLMLYDSRGSFQISHNWKATRLDLPFTLICAHYGTHTHTQTYICIKSIYVCVYNVCMLYCTIYLYCR